jgi:hypothetical protein
MTFRPLPMGSGLLHGLHDELAGGVKISYKKKEPANDAGSFFELYRIIRAR